MDIRGKVAMAMAMELILRRLIARLKMVQLSKSGQGK